jgi:hypothetical protein
MVYLDALGWNLKQMLRLRLLQLLRGRWACSANCSTTLRSKLAGTTRSTPRPSTVLRSGNTDCNDASYLSPGGAK